MERPGSPPKWIISYCLVAALLWTLSLISWAQQGQAPHIDSNEIQRIQKKSASLSAKERAETREFFKAAFAAYQAGRFEEAEVLFGKGLQIDQANVDAQFFFGMVLRERKKTADAIKAFSFAAALGPNTVNGTRAALEAKSLMGNPGTVFRDCADCPEMVIIPAGSFEMGSPSDEAGRFKQEGPIHRVNVPAFALGRTHVTRGQFAAFVNETGYDAGRECWTFEEGKVEQRPSRNWRDPGYRQEDGHPVVCVIWNDAKAYVDWLSRKTGKRYRLPTEAEWEFAARAGTTTARYWGESPDQACGYANVMDNTGKRTVPGVTWAGHNCDDGHAYSAPAGSFKPNAFGLYDIIGNAWQLVEDCWHGNYNGAPTDGSAWAGCDSSVERVLRGGSWGAGPDNARSAMRAGCSPTNRGHDCGFRLARMLP